MKTYKQFIKENDEFIVSLLDVENSLKGVFLDTKVSSVSTVYEEDDKTKQLKLIMTVNNLFYDKTDILHTKFIFIVDDKKRKLLENKFFYLYDINCNFKEVNFDDTEDLDRKLNKIVNDRDFGEDIKNLSDINITLATDVNNWLKENGVETLSIYTITYSPIVDNIPCESLSFKFDMNIDDERNVELRIKKINDKKYNYTFKEGDWFYDVEITDIKGTVQTIGETIKNHII